MTPERPDLVLATDVPNIELDILIRNGLDVEANRGNGRHSLVQLQFVEDS